MALRSRVRAGQVQRLALTPALREGLALLRMSALELAEAAQRIAAENPFVELLPPRPAGEAAHAAALEGIAAPPSRHERLLRQIAALSAPPEVRRAAALLAGALDEAGYLDAPLEAIAAEAGLPPALAEAGLAALQACEPAGVGARDLEECLALQLRDRGFGAAEAARLVAGLDFIARDDMAGLARHLGTDAAGARAAAAVLRGLSPRPFSDGGEPVPPLLPDLVLEEGRGGVPVVRLGRAGLPRLRLDRALLAEAEAAGFGAGPQAEAAAFLAALRFRGATLLAVGRILVARQYRAFALGPEHLAPLTRAEVAAELGLHPSTVGRAVAGKAILAAGRLWPLAELFSAALPGAGGRPVSAHAVQRRLARLIAAEPPGAPLSDAELAARLAAEGVDIARRTVAKYRQSLRIPARAGRRKGRERKLGQSLQTDGRGGGGAPPLPLRGPAGPGPAGASAGLRQGRTRTMEEQEDP